MYSLFCCYNNLTRSTLNRTFGARSPPMLEPEELNDLLVREDEVCEWETLH